MRVRHLSVNFDVKSIRVDLMARGRKASMCVYIITQPPPGEAILVSLIISIFISSMDQVKTEERGRKTHP